MTAITKVFARQILDSRGNPTIEVDVFSESGFGRAAVPSGASTGSHEALELRDGDKRKYNGKGVLKAVNNVNKIIAPKLAGRDCLIQKEIDEFLIKLDGTKNKTRLGANAMLGVSMACARATATEKKIPLYQHIQETAGIEGKKYILPVPLMNIINGGAHAGNQLAIQEAMIVPLGANNFSEAIRAGAEAYHTLKSVILGKYGKNAINVGDEGGFAPPINSITEALELITESIRKSGYNGKVMIALDCAASEFYKDGKYNLEGLNMSSAELKEFYKALIKKYPIISIEDPFAEDDFAGFASLTSEIGRSTQIVGDDLLVTNTERIQKAINEKACNSLLLKLNQIGTVTEAINAAKMAKQNNWSVIVSHRSGETEDSFIADFAVGIQATQLKSGAPCRSERLAKYNQLLRREEELGRNAVFAGKKIR